MKFTPVLFLMLSLLFACSKKEETIVARVDDEKLTLKEFKASFTEENWNNSSIKEKQAHVREWMDLTLLAREADRVKITENLQIKGRIENSIKKVKSNALLTQVFASMEISEDELFNYYRLHKSKYQKKEKEYKLQRIFIREKVIVDSVLAEIKEGLKFTDAAKTHSEENLGRNGGYTGFLSREKMGNIIWNKIKTLAKWQHSMVKTDKGYYIIRYFETRTVSKDKTFIEVEDEIREIVKQEKREEFLFNLLQELKKEAEISISI